MLKLRHLTLGALALALALSLTATRASADDTKKDTGSINGTVKGSDDKPVAGALVRLLHPMSHADKKADKASKQAKGADKPVPVATATTDNDGKYEMKDVPTGDYVVQCQVKGQGSAHEHVTVKSGDTATVDLKLAHKGGAASAGGAAPAGGDKPADSK